MLSLLARLGSMVERDPELLLLRSGIHRQVGRVDESIADVDRAVERSYAAPPQVQRRVAIESARARLVEGKTELAEQIIHTTLSELGEGEGRTFARAHQALAECAIDSAARDDLQRAAESLLVAASAWEACSEFALARACRTLAGARGAQPARPLRRGAGPDRSAARRARPLRRRALVHVRVRGLHPLQRQPARRRRAALRAHRRPRVPARQPPARRAGGMGDGARRVAADGRARHAAVDPHRRAHRAEQGRRRPRRAVPLRCRRHAGRARRHRTAPQRYLAQAFERGLDVLRAGPRRRSSSSTLDRGSSATSRRPCAGPPRWAGGGSSSSRPTRWPSTATSTGAAADARRRPARAALARVRRLRVARRESDRRRARGAAAASRRRRRRATADAPVQPVAVADRRPCAARGSR